MQWFTEFEIPKSPFPISHQSKILSMGSCFAQSMGTRMNIHKFNISINPFGTIFHPLALHNLLDMALEKRAINENQILEREGMYFHFSAHSDLVGTSQKELIEKFNQKIETTSSYLKSGSHLILTFGTAWIYEHQDFGPVANCHKQPQGIFKKRLSDLEEMKRAFLEFFKKLTVANPGLKIILTVSPVRHIKDGIPENQLSKSMLRVLCHQLEEEFDSIAYFPSYEIMMDELRDYRFYKEDRIHPTEEAENHIWKKWMKTYFSSETQQKVNAIAKIQQELAHRPLNPNSESHRKFLQNLLGKLERLDSEFDFSIEINKVKQKLDGLNS